MTDQPYEEDVKGFLKRQRQWFLERDGYRCCFMTCRDGVWRRCQNTANLEAHHVLPRGWYKEHSSRLWDVNSPENGIMLCRQHHRGKGAAFSDRYIIHPDNQDALSDYRSGNDKAFKDMKVRRHELNMRGIPYWNSRWDWLLYRIIKRHNQEFDEEYPYRDNPDYMHEDGDQHADLFG